MMTDHPHKTLQRMETMLRRCRRRIMLARLSARLREGLEFYLACLLAIAGFFLLFRIVACAVGVPATHDWMVALWAAVIFGSVIFGRALLSGVWGNPIHADSNSTRSAAERLDLSQSTHNRIATAVALLQQCDNNNCVDRVAGGDDSPFAEAAIRDGLEYLERLQAEQPHTEASATSWHRKGVWLTLSLAMVLAGQFLEAETRMRSGGETSGEEPAMSDSTPPCLGVLASLDHEPATVAPDIAIKPNGRITNRDDRQPVGDTSARDDAPAESDTGRRAEPDKETHSEGPAGQHASGKSRSSQSSSNSRSAASGVGAKSEPGTTEPAKGTKPRDGKKPTVGQPKVDQKNQKGGSINARGSSGSSSMRTAQNEWSGEVKARSSDSDEFEQEEEPDDEMDPDKQRLGVQPALKSRTSRLSRELSLAMGTGLSNDMMKGRGGANAPKKARGTATMIMGVPVPGFVKGRLLPGPTKSTQEEVEPSPREGDYAAASQLQQATPEESPQQRYRPSAAMSVQARDYLIKYHAESENKRNGAATNE